MQRQESIPLLKRLTFRITAQILVVVVAALCLNAYLNYSNFDKTQRQLAESRILVSSGEVKRAISSALELGLSLEELSNLSEILHRGLASGKADGIKDLSILNNGGQIIASSSVTPPDWSNVASWPVERQQKESLRSLATDRFAIGMPLMSAFGDLSGWLIIAYDGSNQLDARTRMIKETLVNLLISIVLAMGLLSVGVYILTRSFVNGLARIGDPGLALDSQLAPLSTDYQRFVDETDALLKNPLQYGQKETADAP
ncbi:MAG: hypothetical protein ACOYBR_01500 [Fluviibacter sp.]